MATVFLARAEGLGGFERDVAVKLIHAHLRENSELALSLLNEARIAARIRHPNVVPVYDVGEDPAGIFLVMEYVEGDTLSGLQRAARAMGQKIPPAIALRILTDALAGLQSAHEQRDANGEPLEIVHRDFSPQNILVGTDGISRLTDFGIAKAAGRSGHTSPGSIKGKVGYMAPEQARGKVVDRRCDVWAAGVVAWELLAGRPLHVGDDEVATLLDVVTKDPPDLRGVDPTISDPLADVVTSALMVDRHHRCPTAAELRRRLIEACGDSLTLADPSQVAAFLASMGGGRTITPLPYETPAPHASAIEHQPSPETPPTLRSGRHSHETMTLQSVVMGAIEGAKTADSPEALSGSLAAFRPRRALLRPWIGVAVLAVAISAGGVFLTRAQAPVGWQGPAAPVVENPSVPASSSAVAVTPPAPVPPAEPVPSLTRMPAPDALSTAVPGLAFHAAALTRRFSPSEKRSSHASRRAHARMGHSKPAPSRTAGVATRVSTDIVPHGPPPLAGNPYAGTRP